MTTPEQAAWNALRPVMLRAGLDPCRVENVVWPGFPDVDYAGGNIELKAIHDWPARLDTIIKVPHYTGEQAGWLARRWQHRGASWLMVRVGVAWFLFDGWTALEVKRGLTRGEWHRRAILCVNDVRANSWQHGREQTNVTRLRAWLRLEPQEMLRYDRAQFYRLTCFKDGGHPMSRAELAANLGWGPERVEQAELGVGPSDDTRALLDWWET